MKDFDRWFRDSTEKPAQKMVRVLTPEAEDDSLDFVRDHGSEGNCSCHISPPCNSCMHPGNPLQLKSNDAAWMLVPEDQA